MTTIMKKLSDLQDASALTGSEFLEVTQNSSSKKISVSALSDFVENNVVISQPPTSFTQKVTMTDGATSGASPSTNADALVIQGNVNTGIHILSKDTYSPQIRMGHQSDANGFVGFLLYNGGNQIFRMLCDNVEVTGNLDVGGILNVDNMKIQESVSGVSQFSGDADGLTIESATNTGIHIVTANAAFPQIRLGHAGAASGLIMFLTYNGGSQILNWWVPRTEMNGDLDVAGTMSCASLSVESVGTFTPVLKGSTTSGSNTYAHQFGRYAILGDMVTIETKVTLSGSIDAGTGGEIRLATLPSPVKSGFDCPLSIGAYSGINLPTGFSLGAEAIAGTSEIRLIMQNNTASSVLDKTHISSGFSVTLSGTYRK